MDTFHRTISISFLAINDLQQISPSCKVSDYSCVPDKRAGPNKRAGWKMGQN